MAALPDAVAGHVGSAPAVSAEAEPVEPTWLPGYGVSQATHRMRLGALALILWIATALFSPSMSGPVFLFFYLGSWVVLVAARLYLGGLLHGAGVWCAGVFVSVGALRFAIGTIFLDMHRWGLLSVMALLGGFLLAASGSDAGRGGGSWGDDSEAWGATGCGGGCAGDCGGSCGGGCGGGCGGCG